MVIDSHTHIREGNEDIGAFLAGMDEAGVDMAVVSPIAPVELGFHDNKYIAELVKEHPDRIIGYASVHPADLNALDELRRGVED
ncbi:MAG: amidohydrolase family protein, partial [Emergencia timonensis]